MAWPNETALIRSEDELYIHVHCNKVTYSSGTAQPNETCIVDPMQSCDWSRYHTPEETRALLGKQYRTKTTEFKNPNAFFVIAHFVSDWEETNTVVDEQHRQVVKHDPLQPEDAEEGRPANRAHCEVHGDKSLQVRTEMTRRARWAIAPPSSKSELKEYKKSHGIQ